MPFVDTDNNSLLPVSLFKKRLRRVTALGLYNLTVKDLIFTVHFTLHRNGKTVAFYTSEPIHNQRNPEWSSMDFAESVQCLQEFVMGIWITTSGFSRLFLRYDIHLDDSLQIDEQYGETTQGHNCLWLDMFGYRFIDDGEESHPSPVISQPVSTHRKERLSISTSYNVLSILRMVNLLRGIRNAQQASAIYLQRLQTLVNEKRTYLSQLSKRECLQSRIHNLQEYLTYHTCVYQQRLLVHRQKQQAVESRRNQLHRNLLQLALHQVEIDSYVGYLEESRSVLHQLLQVISYRQKIILKEISQDVYPIRCTGSNEYSIVDIRLPRADDRIYDASSNRERDRDIGAALGFCSHLVLLISQIIHLPLRFPIVCHQTATWKIYDDTLDMNEFPLYPNLDLSAFRYGFYLLNRNIGQILHHCHVSHGHIDCRKTLENLKLFMEQYANSNAD